MKSLQFQEVEPDSRRHHSIPGQSSRVLSPSHLIGILLLTIPACNSVESITQPRPTTESVVGSYLIESYVEPERTVVRDEDGRWLATFTKGAYTVTYRGLERSYSEGGRTLETETWARILPEPFNGEVDTVYLAQLMADTSPDIIEIAMQYVDSAPPIMHGDLQIAGEAGYGSSIGADFNDYLGIDWVYPNGATRRPEPEFYQKLDAAGYIRMIFGFRGTPHRILLSVTHKFISVPRTVYNQYLHGTGVILIEDRMKRPSAAELLALQPGDLLFWDSAPPGETPAGIDHVGVYLGRDTDGHMRFISSLPTIDGPGFGRGRGEDFRIDGKGYWARRLRGARRL